MRVHVMGYPFYGRYADWGRGARGRFWGRVLLIEMAGLGRFRGEKILFNLLSAFTLKKAELSY